MADEVSNGLVLSIEHSQQIHVAADGTATRGYETYIREYVGMLESGLMARLSNPAYKTLHALALRARILGDPRRSGAEDEFHELMRLGIVSQEDRGLLFCFPSREQLMEDTGIRSVHTIDTVLDELAEMKIVKRITPAQPRLMRGLFGSNVYIIHPESFIGKFGAGDGEQKLLPVEGTGSSLRNSDNCPLKNIDCTTTTNSLRECAPEVLRVIEIYAQTIDAEGYEPTEKEIQRIAALFAEGFSEEQIREGISRAVEQAHANGRTANLTFCARIVRSIYSTQREIVHDNSKSSMGQIVADDGKSSAQIVPVASKSYALLLDGLELDEQAPVEFVNLIALIEEHSQRTITKAEARRWQVLSDDFRTLAAARGVTPMTVVRQAVEEALDAGSARNGYCAPKLARTILSRWSQAQAREKQKTPTPKREIPLAVQVYRQVRRRYPAQELWDTIAQTVGTDETALGFWRDALKAWVGRGYNPMNVTGPLEWFKRREIPKNGNPAPTANGMSQQRPIETLETIQERLRFAARAQARQGTQEISNQKANEE